MSRGRERSGLRPKEAAVRITIEATGQVVEVDYASLTGRERQKLKAMIRSLEEPDEMDELIAVTTLVLQRTDPAITLDEVLDAITIGDLANVEHLAEDELAGEASGG